MQTGRLSSLVKVLADQQTLSGNAIKLSKKSGLSKHFFYSLRDSNRAVKADSAEKFLEAIDHPIIAIIEHYLEEAKQQAKAA